jgi:hypothetical protein
MIVKQTEPSGKKKKKISGTGEGSMFICTGIHFFYIPHINLFKYTIITIDIKYKPSACKFQWQKEKKGIKKYIYKIEIRRRKRVDE